MEHTPLSRLDNRELLLHADNAGDPLTTSDIEIELAKRLAELLDLFNEIAKRVSDLDDLVPPTN